ncbi:head-to-tail adaptor [Mycobacterium phage Serendipitous]|uniref:Head-to-tail adaptor n=1 Tax=Mycobacterium phage Serendipitous TaxID=2301619 RepID=A0A385UIB6_9CAUD|nr:head-tail adaptor [Mycobacterium phage Serendipitous]AYB70563.1 head-to-tail adaptor [Mycobacterium phage Serendipitous]
MTFEWPVERSLLPALPELTDPPSAEYTQALLQRDAAEALAIQVLWALSGRQFGLRTITARPCRSPLPHELFGREGGTVITSYVLSWEGYGWVTWPCGCAGPCREIGPNMVHLPGPVAEVVSVEINGAELDPAQWKVEGNVLYRLTAPWPVQDLNRPLGNTGTWGVTYKIGLPVPGGVAELTALLAKEFLAAIAGGGNCRLPRTVTTASRQGVTYRVYDPAVIYANGKTGLAEVDMWLASVNPHHLMASPTVR